MNTADPVPGLFGVGDGSFPPDSGSKVARTIGGISGAVVGAYEDYHPGFSGDTHAPANVVRFHDDRGSTEDNHSIDKLYMQHFPAPTSGPWSKTGPWAGN